MTVVSLPATRLPYDDAAEVYVASGLWPIPVRGKNPPVTGTTGYDGTVTVEKIGRWLDPAPVRRARAGRGAGMDNVALRHDLTLAIDVDHGYGQKDGVAQLAEFAAKHGLPPLPATWSSTARGDDSPSRQYVYRIPERARFKTKPCGSVELCTWHHRFTVCAPSVHPDTGAVYAWYLPGARGVPPSWGARTARYPRAEAFPELPGPWVAVLRGSAPNADRHAAVVDLPELLGTFAPGPADALIAHLIAKWSDPAVHVGHDEAKSALVHALMLGREGHSGVPELFELLVRRLAAYLADARPGQAERETISLVAACAEIAQQKPLRTGVRYLTPTPEQFMAGVTPTAPVDAEEPSGEPVTDEDLDAFLATFTAYSSPRRLARRIGWMKAEPAGRLPWHAVHLVRDAIAGHYPADRAARALVDGCRHHGLTSVDVPRNALRAALSVVLSARASA